MLLPTTIAATADETATTYACATVTGDGSYVFIKYVVDSSLLPQMQECPFDFAIDVFYILGSWTPSGSGFTDAITGIEFITTEDISGRPVTVEYLYSVPATDLSGAQVFSWEGPASGIANSDGFVHLSMAVSPNIDYYRSYVAHSEFYRVDYWRVL